MPLATDHDLVLIPQQPEHTGLQIKEWEWGWHSAVLHLISQSQNL